MQPQETRGELHKQLPEPEALRLITEAIARKYIAIPLAIDGNGLRVAMADPTDIFALAATIDSKDHYTHKHSKNVTKYALILAEALGLEPPEITRLENCALLHDIGKIGIGNEILTKQGKLTEEEWEIVKTHPVLGATIASRAHQLAPYIAGIMHHHERYDGSGYPKGLKGEDIPLEARILAIADAFAAITSERPYAATLSYDRAFEEIKRGAGKQFDPCLVEIFLSATRKLVPRHKEKHEEVKSLKAKPI